MSLKHLLALAGLVAVAACQSPTENQTLCSWFGAGPGVQEADVDEDTYGCVAGDPSNNLFPVPAPVAEPDPDEDA